MKVLHIETGRHLYGGARQVLYLIEGLRKHGVQNLLVCAADAEIAQHSAADAVYPLPISGDLDLRFAYRLTALIRREKPDVVHLHSRRGADVLGGIAARWSGVPAVLSRRVDNAESKLWVALKYRLYGAVVGISAKICEMLHSEGLPQAKLNCVPSAVETTRYANGGDAAYFAQCVGGLPETRSIAMVAQFIPRKGHAVLLEALPQVIAQHPDVRFALFGQGPLLSEIRTEVGRQGLGKHVSFPGFVPDLERLLPCFYALVHPASKEGLGVSLLEAGAAGLPIIAARAGGIPEIVTDGENGLLVPPDDPLALAEALNRLLGDCGLRERLASNARQTIADRFSIERMVQGNNAIYRKLMRES